MGQNEKPDSKFYNDRDPNFFGQAIEEISATIDQAAEKPFPFPDYKYREREIMNQVMKYIDSTYREHYVHESANIETGQLILADPERGLGFCIGNVLKYADRYGRKNGFNEKDLFKVIHYAVMALSINHSNSKTI